MSEEFWLLISAVFTILNFVFAVLYGSGWFWFGAGVGTGALPLLIGDHR